MHYLNSLLLVVFVLAYNSVFARTNFVFADLASYKIDIDSNFSGAELLLFGKIDNDEELVVLIKGPKKSYVVKKREPLYGFWIKTKVLNIRDVAGFYYIEKINTLENSYDKVNIDKLGGGMAGILPKLKTGNADDENFINSFVSIMVKNNLYKDISESNIYQQHNSFFKRTIVFPSNIPVGRYCVEILLFKKDRLEGMHIIPITVENKGMSAIILRFAREHSFLYGIGIVVVSICIGLLSNIILNKE